MKTGIVVGIVLIVLVIVSLAYQGITYTWHKKVVDVGPIQATAKTDMIAYPPTATSLGRQI